MTKGIEGNKLVMKVGGSLVYDTSLNINSPFLSMFTDWVRDVKSRYASIVIVVGGGQITRHLNNEIEGFTTSSHQKHALGMTVTNLNAQIISIALGLECINPPRSLGEVIERVVVDKEHIVLCGGYKEGWSTDMDAAVIADLLDINKVYKLSNVDGVYTADPKVQLDARRLSSMTWREYMDLFDISENSVMSPGAHSPVGVSASLFAAKKGITFAMGGGKDIAQFESIESALQNGTLIHP